MNNLLIMIKYGFDSLEEEIKQEFLNNGWNLNGVSSKKITEDDAKVLWCDLYKIDYELFKGNYEYNKQGECIGLYFSKELEDNDYINVRNIVIKFRTKYGSKDNIFANVLHSSDNNERAEEEIKIFFK